MSNMTMDNLAEQINNIVGDGGTETANNKYNYFCVWFHSIELKRMLVVETDLTAE